MSLFELTSDQLIACQQADFASLRIRERADLQRVLLAKISIIDEDLLVIAEEFGEWLDAHRRIDLLALDKSGRLVVIELKRTGDAGHAELQALRYAAMVAPMTFSDVVATYAVHLTRHRPGADIDARVDLLTFLGLEEDDEDAEILSRPRIMLVAGGFDREVTTTVLWLNEFEGMDIRCVRMVPYDVGGRVFLDVTQIIPLPEAADYQVRIKRKDSERERLRANDWDESSFFNAAEKNCPDVVAAFRSVAEDTRSNLRGELAGGRGPQPRLNGNIPWRGRSYLAWRMSANPAKPGFGIMFQYLFSNGSGFPRERLHQFVEDLWDLPGVEATWKGVEPSWAYVNFLPAREFFSGPDAVRRLCSALGQLFAP